jgi:hypothetical protein
MTAPRVGHTATLFSDNSVLFAGGNTDSMELFTPTDQKFTLDQATMSVVRTGDWAFELSDTRLLFFQGDTGNTIDEYNPTTDTVTPKGSLDFHASSSTLLANGKVFVLGTDVSGLYNPDAVPPAPDFTQFDETTVPNSGILPRSGQTATELKGDKKIYVAGGVDNNNLLQGAALFNPARIWTDRDDYLPGDNVILSGSGWKPNENVYLYAVDDTDQSWTYGSTETADANGGFVVDPYFVVQLVQLGANFSVSAVGAQSAMQANVKFTDSVSSVSIVQPNGFPAGGYTVTSGGTLSVPYAFTYATSGTGQGGNTNPTTSITYHVYLRNNSTDYEIASATVTGLTNGTHTVGTAASPIFVSVPFDGSNLPSTVQNYDLKVTVNANDGGGTGSATATAGGALSPYVKVQAIPTTTTVTSSSVGNTSTYGDSVTFTATVTRTTGSGTPTGSVNFTIAGIGTVAGTAGTTTSTTATWTYTTSATELTAGNHSVSANYVPTGSFGSSSGSLAGVGQVVKKADATVVVTPYNVDYDAQQHTATASITGVNGETGATVGTANLTNTQHTNAGTYSSDTWSFTGGPNYNNIGTTTISSPDVINKASPTITWANPVNITYGTQLSATQLNATASVPGTFAYNPAAGTVLNAGNNQPLSVTFTPTDQTNYNTATKSVSINVLKATPTITWPNPANITYGTALSATQLNATASVPGAFAYSPAAGTVLNFGANQTLHVDFTPTDATNYNSASKNVTINVQKASTTTTITSDQPDPSTTVQPVTVNYTVSTAAPGAGTPTGSVTVSDGVNNCTGSVGVGGLGSCNLTLTTVGNRILTATYAPNSTNYSGSTSAGEPHTVNPPCTAPSISVTNSPVTFNGSPQAANVVGSVAGNVTNIKYNLSSTIPTNAGTYPVTADFAPTDNTNYDNLTGTSAGNFVIAPANATINVSSDYTVIYDGFAHGVSGTAFGVCSGGTPDLSNLLDRGASFIDYPGGTANWTFNASNTNPNYNSASGSVVITINKADPVMTATGGTFPYNGLAHAGSGTATGVLGESLTPVNVVYSLAPPGPGNLFTSAPVNAGTYLVAARYAGSLNYNPKQSAAANLIITKVDLTVTADNKSVQYSDPLPTLTYTITGFVNNESEASLRASSDLSGYPSITTTATVSGGNVYSGPGNYSIIPTKGNLGATNYNFPAGNFVNGTLTVTKEDARGTYTGAMFVSTATPTATTATVTLRATIQDITAADPTQSPPNPDNYPGDIRNATVTFVVVEANQTFGPFPVVLLDPSDTKTGTVSYDWLNAPLGSYTVRIIVNNYYTRDDAADDGVVQVSQLTPGSINGGGYLVMQSSGGLKPGGVGTKNNFGFNVQNTKTGVKGNLNTIIRNSGRTYQVKGNSMTSLSTQLPTPPATTPGTATFTGKANIQDITDQTHPVSIDGNATLQVTMTDNGEPGANDTIGISVWSKSGPLWFSSNWTGTKTVEQKLGGGNLAVR